MKYLATFYFGQLLIIHCALVLSQTDQECTPNPCETTECLRYLTATCNITEDCSARFFWKGRDVTDRCNVRTCDDRTCPNRRDCMESVFPAICPPNNSGCRQYIRTRCMLRRRSGPLSCDDIKCNDGLMCRSRERVEGFLPVVRCVPFVPRDCSELTCDEGLECIVRGRKASCIPVVTTSPSVVTPTSTTPNTMITAESCDQLDCLSLFLVCNQVDETLAMCEPARECTAGFNASCSRINFVCEITPIGFATCVFPSNCNQLACNENQTCFEFSFGNGTLAQCVDSIETPMIGLRCEDISCPSSQDCLLSSYPSLNLSLASCVNNAVLNSIIASTQFLNPPTCSDMECSEATACIDLQMGENSIGSSCIPQMCSGNSDCGESQECILLTPLQLSGIPDSICTPRELQSRISNSTCEEKERICPEGTVCQNAYLNEILVGTVCNFPVNIGERCDEVECVQENTGCVENSIPSMPEIPGLASCLNNFQEITMAAILGLRAHGLIE